MFTKYIEGLVKEAHQQEAQKQMSKLTVGELAKLAGIKLSSDACPKCGGAMAKHGDMVKCSCGFSKVAGIKSLTPFLDDAVDIGVRMVSKKGPGAGEPLPQKELQGRLHKLTGAVKEAGFLGVPGAVAGGLIGAGAGAAGAGEGHRLKGALIGGAGGAAIGGVGHHVLLNRPAFQEAATSVGNLSERLHRNPELVHSILSEMNPQHLQTLSRTGFGEIGGAAATGAAMYGAGRMMRTPQKTASIKKQALLGAGALGAGIKDVAVNAGKSLMGTARGVKGTFDMARQGIERQGTHLVNSPGGPMGIGKALFHTGMQHPGAAGVMMAAPLAAVGTYELGKHSSVELLKVGDAAGRLLAKVAFSVTTEGSPGPQRGR